MYSNFKPLVSSGSFSVSRESVLRRGSSTALALRVREGQGEFVVGGAVTVRSQVSHTHVQNSHPLCVFPSQEAALSSPRSPTPPHHQSRYHNMAVVRFTARHLLAVLCVPGGR